MTTLTYEQKKQRYSQELAAHTLRQWIAARESMEKTRSATPTARPQKSGNVQPSVSPRSAPRTPRNDLQVIDYGHMSSKHANGGQSKDRSQATHL